MFYVELLTPLVLFVYIHIMNMTEQDFAAIARNCLSRKAKMADRAITRAYDEALRPVELRITQFTLLVAIGYGAPGSLSELAEWLAMERTTLTRNLKLLEEQGLIQSQCGLHHRAKALSLSAKGQAKLAAAYPLWQGVQDSFQHAFGEAQWQHSHHALERLAALVR